MTAAYRCSACGNKTRFDVYETVRRRRFEHFDLAGSATTEEEEILEHTVEKVVCRWCERSDAIERVDPNPNPNPNPNRNPNPNPNPNQA